MLRNLVRMIPMKVREKIRTAINPSIQGKVEFDSGARARFIGAIQEDIETLENEYNVDVAQWDVSV